MADPERVYVVLRGRGSKHIPSKRAIEMAFRWRADDGPTMNAGLVAL